MFEIFAITLFFIGIIGMAVIVFIKIPVLAGLDSSGFQPGIFKKIRTKAKESKIFKLLSIQALSQTILSKIKVLTLKIENKISSCLAKMRQKNIQKKTKFSEDYWEKLKGGKE